MALLDQKLSLPASESSTRIVLSACVITMGLLSIALIWQAEIISHQRDLIRWLLAAKFGG